MIAPGNGSVSAMEPAAFSIEESETPSSDPSGSAELEQSPTAAPDRSPSDEPDAEPPASEPAPEPTAPCPDDDLRRPPGKGPLE